MGGGVRGCRPSPARGVDCLCRLGTLWCVSNSSCSSAMQLGPKGLHLLRARRSAGAPPPKLEQVHGPGRREYSVHRRLGARLGRRPRGRVHRAALVHRCLRCACACACAFALTSHTHAACCMLHVHVHATCTCTCTCTCACTCHMCMCTLHVHWRHCLGLGLLRV